MHNIVDEEGFVGKAYGTPANESDTKNFAPLLDDLPENTMVYADKGYCSKENEVCFSHQTKIIDLQSK